MLVKIVFELMFFAVFVVILFECGNPRTYWKDRYIDKLDRVFYVAYWMALFSWICVLVDHIKEM